MKKILIITCLSICMAVFSLSCSREDEWMAFMPLEMDIQGGENISRPDEFNTYAEIAAHGGEIILQVEKETKLGFAINANAGTHSENLFIYPWFENFHIDDEYSATWGSIKYLSTDPHTVIMIKINPNNLTTTRYIKFTIENAYDVGYFHLTQKGQ